MRKLSMMTAVAALCLAFTARAHAGAYEYSAAKVQIDVPGGWLAAEADGVLTVQASDGSVAIVIATMDAKDAKKGAAALDKQVAAFIPDASLAKAKAAEVNGLKGYMRRGTGTLDGAPVEMGILVLLTPSKQVIMVMALGATGQYEVHGDAMNAALASISPIRLTMPQAFYDELGDAKGTAAVKALLKAIDDNDSAALSKLFAKEFSYYGTSTKGATVKSKGKKNVAEWLKMPDAPWYWEIMAGPAFVIKRGSGYGENWAVEFFDEGFESGKATWRIVAISFYDEGEP